ncbi:HlyD family secretion protein [Agaribacter marinus]|uniref:AprE-like beta-barrel domain-containing protein n=1 Tax=Agaribacter marinus TaxID=1431249 RepID=A0AA37SV11_9ALTE|nr:HlyD family efflux transporter periplasmic adaptor subunit [Agaribacter marinus]GLR70371.1 hypothetical protein GCM10007852_12790 [Agaribacter marinus]
MSNPESPDEQVSFRQESVDNVFSQGRKPFFVQSPPTLTAYTFAFLVLLAFVFTSLYFIKLPIHILAVGEVIAGKDYHQIVINEDDQIVANIHVTEGDEVREGQSLLHLESRNKVSLETELRDISLQIQAIEQQLSESRRYYLNTVQNIDLQLVEQDSVINQIENALVNEKKVLKRYKQNVAQGLTAATLEDDQKRIVAQIEGNLIKEKSHITSLELRMLNVEENFKQQQSTGNTQIERLTLSKERLTNGLQVLSPCNCIVDNLFTEKGLPIISGQSVLTLSQARDTSSLILYVPAKQYREIKIGNHIQVKVAAYPSNKYGALNATVTSVSNSPVPGNMINKKGQGLGDTTYFVVKAEIDNVPRDVTLVTGMAVDSDIVVDRTSLFDLMFNFEA